MKAADNHGSPEVKAEGGNSPRAVSKVFLEVEDGSVRTIAAAEGGEHVPNGNATHSPLSNGGEGEAGGEDGRETSSSPYSNRQTTVWPAKLGGQRIVHSVIVLTIAGVLT